MSLLLRELEAFVQEHGRCGELDGGVEGETVWMTCTCGALIVRRTNAAEESIPRLASDSKSLEERRVATFRSREPLIEPTTD